MFAIVTEHFHALVRQESVTHSGSHPPCLLHGQEIPRADNLRALKFRRPDRRIERKLRQGFLYFFHAFRTSAAAASSRLPRSSFVGRDIHMSPWEEQRGLSETERKCKLRSENTAELFDGAKGREAS